MKVKAFEIRDIGTFIPAMGIEMVPSEIKGLSGLGDQTPISRPNESERYLLRRAGYEFNIPCIVLVRIECKGVDRNATYDPHSWGDRTWKVAHLFIQEHWKELETGAVIDVEFILGETTHPKESESKYEHPTAY